MASNLFFRVTRIAVTRREHNLVADGLIFCQQTLFHMAVRNHEEFVAHTFQFLYEFDDFIIGKQFACLTDVLQFHQRIGANELHLQVGQRMDAVVVGSIICGLLLAHQRYEET